MITLNVKGHSDMCGGYSYSGTASFEGKTVKEVLDEIREYAKDKDARYLGDGFGNPKSNSCDAWKIEINGVIYWNSWIAQKWWKFGKYTEELGNLYVDEIIVDGGWYCFYDFNIIAKKEEPIPVEKQTNLNTIKNICKGLFLAVPIKANEQFSFLIQHPFASNNIVAVPEGSNFQAYLGAIQKILVTGEDSNGYVKLSQGRVAYLEDLQKHLIKNNIIDITIPEGAEVYRQHIFKLIDNSNSLDDIIMLLNKPWYMTFIKYTNGYMSPSDLGRILGECWVMQEYPNRDNNANLKEIISWFKEADKNTLMMDEEDFIKYTNIVSGGLGFNLTIYRGVSYSGRPDGLSWTLSKDKACWFASRFKGKNAKVYKMTIDLSNKNEAEAILAYFSGRNEDEIVIDTTVLNNWEVVVE